MLGERRSRAAVPALVQRLKQEDARLAHRILGALAQIGDERAVPALIDLARGADPTLTLRRRPLRRRHRRGGGGGLPPHPRRVTPTRASGRRRARRSTTWPRARTKRGRGPPLTCARRAPRGAPPRSPGRGRFPLRCADHEDPHAPAVVRAGGACLRRSPRPAPEPARRRVLSAPPSPPPSSRSRSATSGSTATSRRRSRRSSAAPGAPSGSSSGRRTATSATASAASSAPTRTACTTAAAGSSAGRIVQGTKWSSIVSVSSTERYEIAAVGETVETPAGKFDGCVRVRAHNRAGQGDRPRPRDHLRARGRAGPDRDLRGRRDGGDPPDQGRAREVPRRGEVTMREVGHRDRGLRHRRRRGALDPAAPRGGHRGAARRPDRRAEGGGARPSQGAGARPRPRAPDRADARTCSPIRRSRWWSSSSAGSTRRSPSCVARSSAASTSSPRTRRCSRPAETRSSGSPARRASTSTTRGRSAAASRSSGRSARRSRPTGSARCTGSSTGRRTSS